MHLVDFLSQKIIEQTKSRQYKFTPYSEARKKIVVEPPFTKQEKEQIRQELNELVNKNYNDV
ncbi:hypothetical protein [Campylobacter troglodytis]|uniref:hypothetical protein n=1 Tax=Campylobacter troglodytis TaxID=654363 RepID=UPI00115B902A|nr:hypothetical protein [Campylobacter troglodytis]TQR54010.1 hypothetical protein DMC01_10635 [Campylobacter troglodytis]